MKGWLKGAVKELKEEMRASEQRTAKQTEDLVEGLKGKGVSEEQLVGWAQGLPQLHSLILPGRNIIPRTCKSGGPRLADGVWHGKASPHHQLKRTNPVVDAEQISKAASNTRSSGMQHVASF